MCGTWSASRAAPSKSAFRLALKQEAGPAAEAPGGAGSLGRRWVAAAEAAAAAAAAPPPRCLTGVWDGDFMVGRAKVPERGVLLTFMKMDDDDSDDDDDDDDDGGGAGGVEAVARYVVTGQGTNRYGSFTLSGEARTLAPLSKLATEEEAAEVGLSVTLATQYVVVAAAAAGAAGAASAAAAAGGGGRSKRKRTEVNYASLDLGSGVGLDGFAPREEARRLEGMLDSKDFSLFDARFPVLEDGSELGARSLLARHGGLREPVLVRRRAGLGMRLPVRGAMAVADVVDAVGAFEPVPVLEVASHRELRDWNLLRWGEYMSTPARERTSTLNVISLEVAATSLAPRVVPPLLVRQLDWVETAWPAELHAAGDVPKVQKYCLMTAAGAWTDFHIDFGGTSVWYHVLTGEKRFYLIPPTAAHLGAYERWAKGDVGGQDVFLPDVLASEAWAAARAAAAAATGSSGEAVAAPPPSCYHLRLHPGETLLIPTGWIHAVFTPVDSLVFGGNFLHSLNVGGQLRLQAMEARMGVEERFRFPHFVRLQWFGAARVLTALRAVAARGGEAAVAAAAAAAAAGGGRVGAARGGGGLNPLTASFAALGEEAMLALDGGAAAREGAGALVRALLAWADGAQRAMEAAAAGAAGAVGGSDGSDGSVRTIVQSAMWAARSVGYLGGAASVEAAVAAEAAAAAAAAAAEGAASKAPAALLAGPRQMLKELAARAAGRDDAVSAPPPPAATAAAAPAQATATVTVPRAETSSSASSSSSSSAGAGGAASGVPRSLMSVKVSLAPPARIPIKMGLSEHMEASAKAKAAKAAQDAKPRPVIKIGGLAEEPASAVEGVLDELFGEEDFEDEEEEELLEEVLDEEEEEEEEVLEEEEEEEDEQARMPVPALKFKLGGGGAIAAVAAPKPLPASAAAPSLKMKFAGGAVVFAGSGGGAGGARRGAAAAGNASLPLLLLLPEGKGQGKFDAAGLEYYREARTLHLSVTAANETKMPKSYARTAAMAAAAEVEAVPDRQRRQSSSSSSAVAASGGPGEDDDGESDYRAPAQKRQRAAASKPRARAATAPKPAAKKKGPSLRERLKMRRR